MKQSDPLYSSDPLYAVAVMHYTHGQTMEAIARKLAVSRSTVSRMLKEARKRGYVNISVSAPDQTSTEVAAWLQEKYGVHAILVPVTADTDENHRLEAVATMGASVVADIAKPHDVIGVAWGNTISRVAHHLGKIHVEGTTVIQLNGALSQVNIDAPYSSGIPEAFAGAFGARLIVFPVPAFFDYAYTREAMWQETSVKAVRKLQMSATFAVFGIGSLSSTLPSAVYSGGYLRDSDIATLRAEGVVGDVCTVLLRADGTWEDLELNQRASGLLPTELQTIARRIAIAAGSGRIRAILAALRAGLVTDLVIDTDTATRLMHYAHQNEHV